MRYIYLYIIVFLQACFTQLKATSTDSLTLNYPYINYTTKDGLPSNETHCVLQDSRGYIWIGTDRGLVKYDGYTFKTYTTLDGLTDNVILAIKEDRHGNLWYTGLNNTQLGYIDPNMRFHKYEYYAALLDSIANKEPYTTERKFKDIHFNEIYFSDDDIYLVNKTRGYVIINNKGVKKVQLDFKELSTVSNCVIEDEGLQFIYSNKSLLYVENFKNEVTVNGEYVHKYLKRNSVDVFPTLLVKDNVKYIYDGKDYIILTTDSCIHERFEYSVSAYKINDNLYIYSLYDHLEEEDIIYISSDPNIRGSKEELFIGDRTVSVMKDINGGIWVSTLRSGVLYFPGLESKSITLDIPVEYMYVEDRGMILGKRGKKYNFTSPYIRSLDYYNLSKFKDITSTNIRFSNSTHIHFYDPEDRRKNNFARFAKGFQRLSDSLEYVYGFGHIYRVENSVVERIYPTLRDVFGKINIESLYGFNSDSCLLGTRSGLYTFSNGKLKQLEYSKNKRIKDLVYIPKYEVLVYVVWGEGIRIQFSNGELHRITEEEGLVSNTVNQLVAYDNHELWIATNRGLNKLIFRDQNKVPEIETVLKSSKILSSPNILQLIVEDSTLYLGTDSGFDVIDIKVLYENKSKDMSLFIDDILINKISQQDTSDFNLEYDENNISIYYTSITFNQFGNIEYRYRLEGLSDEWVYTKQRLASFLQLNPGEYTFILEVQDDHGDWITLEDKPHFVIQKPYWKTGWFIGGISFLILIIGGGALYYYISNLKKEKAFIEDKQQLSERLNESRQKALSAQLNPHFVFNSLNSIQNFILTRRTELSSDYLSMFSKLMRYVFENSKSLYVVLTDEIEALRLYLELEQVRHNHKFQYEIQHNNIDTQDAKLPALLIQPIIENAIWHGLLHKEGDDRNLEIVFSKENQSLKIEVIDNGVGRHKVKPRQKFIKKQRSSGVELTKQRLELLGQSTNSKTSFKIIDLFNEDGSPGGTQVIITIPLIQE